MNLQQKIAVGITDIAILGELCLSLYMANRDLDNYSSIFFKYFFTMLIPTIIFAIVFIKRLAEPECQQGK